MKLISIILLSLFTTTLLNAKLTDKQKAKFAQQNFDGATVFCNKSTSKGKVDYTQLPSGCRSRLSIIDEARAACQSKGGVMSLNLGRECPSTGN